MVGIRCGELVEMVTASTDVRTVVAMLTPSLHFGLSVPSTLLADAE